MRLPKAGDAVTFKNPSSKQKVSGTVVDQAWVVEPSDLSEVAPQNEDGWLETAFVAQLIDWGQGNLRIRFAYYTRRPGQGQDGWKFAQFAPSMSLEETKILFDKVEAKHWLESPARG